MIGRFAALVALVTGLVVTPVSAQRLIVGRLLDARTGHALAAGEVRVEGRSLVDQIRPDGVFILHVPAEEITLLARGPGYQPVKMLVPVERETVFIEMQPNAFRLDDEVVTGRREEGGASVGALRGSAVNRGPATSLTDAMQGKIPGVTVEQSSGAPADLRLQLRGVTSILGPVSPLFVLDGVIVSNAVIESGVTAVTGGQEPLPGRIADLNPRDVASIRVLRGAAAAALYGSRGSNGVVVIETKRGSARR